MIWPFNRKQKIAALQRERTVHYANRLARTITAKYDAAQTTPDNERYWANADCLSANAAADPQTRRTLRSRARYEFQNNSWAKGLVLNMSYDLIGTGPRLQLLGGAQKGASKSEKSFKRWAREIKLGRKLRLMSKNKAVDGEAFAMLTTNPKLKHPVKLDLQVIAASRITTPTMRMSLDTIVDGIEFDEFNNPVRYYMLKQNPGDKGRLGVDDYAVVPASSMIHWFREDDAEQYRGVPELTPALPLFAQIRRYTLAVLAAAETAADFAAVIKATGPAAETNNADVEAMDLVHLESRMATVLPEGWDINQIKAEQPTTTFPDFIRQLLGEVARCMCIPINVITGDSSRHNFASGKLDRLGYLKCLNVERDDCDAIVLSPLFAAWQAEASLVGEISRSAVDAGYSWFWDGLEAVDEVKSATAQAKRLENGTTSLAEECAKEGKDYDQIRQNRLKEAHEEFEIQKVKAEAEQLGKGGDFAAMATAGSNILKFIQANPDEDNKPLRAVATRLLARSAGMELKELAHAA